MKKPENRTITFIGYSEPNTPSELLIEIAGLKHLIAIAKERIRSLEQSLIIAKEFETSE